MKTITQILGIVLLCCMAVGCTAAQTNPDENQDLQTDLKLVVLSGFESEAITITENATPQIIKETMKSLDWEKFHIVWLENEKDSTSVEVGGSLYEDGLSASFDTYDMNYIKEPYPRSVEEMTEILLTYLQGKDALHRKYLFE